jgi:hypothetical protein
MATETIQMTRLIDYTRALGGRVAAAEFMNEPNLAAMVRQPWEYDLESALSLLSAGSLHSRCQPVANACTAASRVNAYPCVGSPCPATRVHAQGFPLGEVVALKMRPTTSPLAPMTSKSSGH